MKAVALFVMVLSCAVVHAADNEPVKVEGKISELQGVTQGDGSFRITLEKAPRLCGTAATHAYINEKDDNFKGIVELALLAKSTKAPVMLLSQKDEQGHCRLLSLTVR